MKSPFRSRRCLSNFALMCLALLPHFFEDYIHRVSSGHRKAVAPPVAELCGLAR